MPGWDGHLEAAVVSPAGSRGILWVAFEGVHVFV